ASVAISPSGRYVTAGDSFIDLEAPGEPGGQREKIPSHAQSAFASNDVLITTRGSTFYRYPLGRSWNERESFTLGDGGLAYLLGSVGPYDVQRRDEAVLLMGFSAPSDKQQGFRLVGGAFGGDRATVQSPISFAGTHGVFASDEFVLVEADVLPDE